MTKLFKKTYTFYPDVKCSGSGPAICEFNRYKGEIEKATGGKVYMVKNVGWTGFEKIIYEVVKENEVKVEVAE